MTDLSVFRRLTDADSRLAFYTSETAHKIPEAPGCYAWFVPLWIYDDDLPTLMQIVRDLRSYDNPSERQVSAGFTWHSIDLRVSRTERIPISAEVAETWRKVLADPPARHAMQRLLLESSILMPPLYVGRTNSLKRRYTQHTKTDGSNFHRRFALHTQTLGISLPVSDLLFACLCTETTVSKDLGRFDDRELTSLIEHILMNACRPPFSIK